MQCNWRKTDNPASWKLPASHNPVNTAHSQPLSCCENLFSSWELVPITSVPKVGFLTLKFTKRLLEICELPELETYVHVSGERMHSFQQNFKVVHDPRTSATRVIFSSHWMSFSLVTVLQAHWLPGLSAAGQCPPHLKSLRTLCPLPRALPTATASFSYSAFGCLIQYHSNYQLLQTTPPNNCPSRHSSPFIINITQLWTFISH